MPRAATTSDIFNAIAEARRRDILVFLADQEHSVNDIVSTFEMSQPSVSKHLRVLAQVGLVEARREGQQIFYRTNADGLRPIHEWAKTFERHWSRQLMRIKARAERAESKQRKP